MPDIPPDKPDIDPTVPPNIRAAAQALGARSSGRARDKERAAYEKARQDRDRAAHEPGAGTVRGQETGPGTGTVRGQNHPRAQETPASGRLTVPNGWGGTYGGQAVAVATRRWQDLARDAREALWKGLPGAIETLLDLHAHSPNAVVRRQAADSIVDRTMGKPTIPVDVRVGVDWSRVPPDLLDAYVSLYQTLLERYPAAPAIAAAVATEGEKEDLARSQNG